MLQGIAGGGMVLEGSFFKLEYSSLIYSFLLQFLILVLLLFIYRMFRPRFDNKKIVLGKRWGWFLIAVQVSFLFFNLIMGINIAGDGVRIEGGSFINYIFILLQPDILFILVGISLLSNRLFLINMMIFLISMALRGWMGGFFIIIFMLLIRYYPVRISVRNAAMLFCTVLLFLFLMPAIIEAKWAMRSGLTVVEFFSSAVDSFSIERYSLAFEYILNRFQHVGHVALLMENTDKVSAAFHSGAFVGYWMDGLPQYTVSKLLGLDTFTLNSYMVEYFFGVTNPTWNTNPGLAGWLFILKQQFVFMILYLFLIVVIPFYFIGKYAGNAMLMLVTCFSITYLFHGWIGAYFNIVFYALLLIIVRKGRFKSTGNT